MAATPARPATPNPTPRGSHLVELERAAVQLGTRTLWSDLDLSLSSGEFLAVLGPNGTGKTTLLKVLLGLVPLSAGSVRVNGRAPRRGNPDLGYVPQQQAFDRSLPIRGRDLVQFGVDGHRLGLPPPGHASVVAGKQDVGHLPAPEPGRTRVLGVLEQPVAEALVGG